MEKVTIKPKGEVLAETRETNAQFVTRMMEVGSPMNQLFVLDALDKWSKYIIKNRKVVLKQMKNSFIHGPSWIRAAEHVQNMLNSRSRT